MKTLIYHVYIAHKQHILYWCSLTSSLTSRSGGGLLVSRSQTAIFSFILGPNIKEKIENENYFLTLGSVFRE